MILIHHITMTSMWARTYSSFWWKEMDKKNIQLFFVLQWIKIKNPSEILILSQFAEEYANISFWGILYFYGVTNQKDKNEYNKNYLHFKCAL